MPQAEFSAALAPPTIADLHAEGVFGPYKIKMSL